MQIVGNNGNPATLPMYVFATSLGTASVLMEIIGPNGATLAQVTLSVTATPKNLQQLYETATGSSWNEKFVGARLTVVSTADIYWNTSGVPVAVNSNGYLIAPSTTISHKVAVGDYRTSPYKLGACN